MEWLAPRPGRFYPSERDLVPIVQELGGPQGRSGGLRKISPPLEFDPRTVQPLAGRYTDWAIQARSNSSSRVNFVSSFAETYSARGRKLDSHFTKIKNNYSVLLCAEELPCTTQCLLRNLHLGAPRLSNEASRVASDLLMTDWNWLRFDHLTIKIEHSTYPVTCNTQTNCKSLAIKFAKEDLCL
jgi:hypothetical protein